MKTRIMLLSSLLLVYLLPLAGYAQDKYVPKANEELYGTWTNEESLGNVYFPQKVVNFPNKYESYSKMSDADPVEVSTLGIGSKWTDTEGNIWYKTFGTVTAGAGEGCHWQELDKLSKSGTVWERVYTVIYGVDFDPKYYPTKIDPARQYYGIFYRVKE